MKKTLCLTLVLCLMLSTSVVAHAEDSLSTYGDDVIAIPVEQDQVTSMDIQLGNDIIVTLSVAEVNGMVYADAHGRYYNKGNGNTISTYGMYVSFTVEYGSISIANGEHFTAYHNSSTSGYTANYEKSIAGENTRSCTAKTKYTLTNSPDTQITIKLSIDNQGSPTVYFNGNYSQHNSDFDLD